MSDDLLLTLLWLLPAAGALLVLFIPGRAETAIKGVSLAITLLTLVLTLVAYAAYVAPGGRASAPLAERAANNVLNPDSGGDEEGDKGAHDLVARRAWIPYFNIQYFLGLDGISLSLVLLTGLV